MAFYPAHNIEGQMIIRDTDSGKCFLSAMEDANFRAAVSKLYDHMSTVKFDCDAAYDWVCEQAGIATFVADEWAWNCFWNVYNSAQSSNA